jgi:diguanylate cyclase (GGDEF)-like protein/putative nucleotidyltransferase with HDIG domain
MAELSASLGGGRAAAGAQWSVEDTAGVGGRVSRRLVGLVVSYFAVYLAWRLSSWGSVASRAWLGDVFFVLPGFPTVVLFWSASRRCSERRTASAWRWLAVSVVFLTATFAVDLGYQLVSGGVPFPSAADGCYLTFYALFFVGLLRFPRRPESRAGRVRLGVDVATVVVAGASVIWFFVLGPTVTASGQSLLDGAIAGAYPVGDLLQIFALTYALTRVASRSTQWALRVLAAGTVVAIVGDTTNGWMILHSQYSLQLAVDLAFMAAWCLFVLAGPAQRQVVADEPVVAGSIAAPELAWVERAGFLPYLAPAAVFGLLFYTQFHGSLFDRASLAIGAGLITLLVLVRQLFARRDLVSARDDLSYQALHDALTGLPNRTLALDRAERMLARARREHTPVAALFLDVDGFKHVNDSFGHAAGDQLLRVVAGRLSSVVRDVDTVGRLGGDEFVVLLDSPTFAASPELVAERILEVLGQPVSLGGAGEARFSVTASIGIAVADEGSDADELLRAADLALYEAKDAGKNRYVLFESSMQAVANDRLLLEMDLHEVVAGEQLFLVYQPIFDLRNQTVTGVEALLRWRHPGRGVIAPDEFIPIAEATGMILPIGRWVLTHACAQAAEWKRHGRQVAIAVNVSGRQLERDEIVDDVRDALMASGLDPALLTLEITETTLMRNPDATARRLRELKSVGVRLAIDDFGTGYSSLAYLRQFPVDALKIDRSFIQGIAASTESAALIHTLVQLGKTLGLETLGEGIEQQAQLRALQDQQCDHGQGFLLARPLELDAIERFLETAPSISRPDVEPSPPRARPSRPPLPQAGAGLGTRARVAATNGTVTSGRSGDPEAQECILVVDDEPAVLGLMANVLSRAGHRVVTASSAADAIQVAADEGITAVLTDVTMPGGISGLELINALHEKRPSLPIIPITGAADESSLREALDRGAAGFITKPFTSAELREKVDAALHRIQLSEVELRERLLAPTVASVLANAIEVRDSGMEGHTERLAALALALGRGTGLTEAELEALELGAVLHDVGKIGIRDSDLLKPDPLTDDERAVIQTHIVVGDQMLVPLDLLEQVRPIVRHHHERWDGTGYPDRLVGEQIPLLARIVAVADSIEAMTGPRPYRSPLSLEGVIEQLQQGRGSQWDPEFVDLALALIQQGKLEFSPNGIHLRDT